jgi:hypothetical protein
MEGFAGQNGGHLMRKLLILASLVVVFLGLSIAPAGAWTYVYDNSPDTGWKTYTYTNNTGSTLSAYAGFVVSNAPDTLFDSQLFIDNLSQADLGNKSFESGDFTGYTLVPGGVGKVVTSASGIEPPFNTYGPTDGTYFAALNDPFGAAAATSTALFKNAYNQSGTTGSILTTTITLTPGQTFSFDWNFSSGDLANPPDGIGGRDFSYFFLAANADGTGAIVQQGLGQLAPVPLPPSILLLGSGLLGLITFRQKIRVNK